jgi:UDP-glucuronate 4-epimerase
VHNPRPILVTGAAGLIGARIVKALREVGYDVIATDRAGATHEPDLKIVQADLTDTLRMTALVKNAGSIIHCGAASGPMVGRDHPAGVASANISGTVTLLELARLFDIRRFVYCSSIVAYGDMDPNLANPVGERAPLTADDVYGASKAAADLMTQAYARQHYLDARIARIGWVYGPGRRTPGIVNNLLRNALDGCPSVFDHDGSYPVQLVHADDVASAVLAVYRADTVPQRTFNVTAGTCVTMRELANMVETILPGSDIRFTPGKVLDDYKQKPLSTEALRSLGWEPRVDIAAGLRSYMEWLSVHPY